MRNLINKIGQVLRRDYSRRDFGKRDFRDRGERREMFKAVCSECGKDCEIPFEPRDGRPVYCVIVLKKRRWFKSSQRFSDRDNRDRHLKENLILKEKRHR
jgi:CxxC-x17-CxxC domain-containing protein